MWGQEALGMGLAWKWLQLLRPGLPSLVPAGSWGSLPTPGPDNGSWGLGGTQEKRGKKEGPRWSSGSFQEEGPGQITWPPQTNSRSFQVSRLKVPGPGRGCTALSGRSGLRRPPGPGGGQTGDCLWVLLQTLLSAKRQFWPLPGGATARAGWRGSGMDWAAPQCPSGSVLVVLLVGLVLVVDAVCRTGIADGLGFVRAAPHGLHEPLHLLSLVYRVAQHILCVHELVLQLQDLGC